MNLNRCQWNKNGHHSESLICTKDINALIVVENYIVQSCPVLSFYTKKRRLPAGKGTHGKHHETNERFAQLGKKDGVKCLHGLLLANSLKCLAVLIPPFYNPNICEIIFDLLSVEEDDSVLQILKQHSPYPSTPQVNLGLKKSNIQIQKNDFHCYNWIYFQIDFFFFFFFKIQYFNKKRKKNVQNLWCGQSNERQDWSCSR